MHVPEDIQHIRTLDVEPTDNEEVILERERTWEQEKVRVYV